MEPDEIEAHVNMINEYLDHMERIKKQRIDKAIKQLPYSQSKEDFVLTALNNYFDLLMRQRLIKQKV